MKGGSSTVVMPGASAGTANSVVRRGVAGSSSDSPGSRAYAATTITAAMSPKVTNHFSPLISQPPGTRRATVRMPDGSLPACSSVTAYASCSSPRSAGTSQRSCSSSLAARQTL